MKEYRGQCQCGVMTQILRDYNTKRVRSYCKSCGREILLTDIDQIEKSSPIFDEVQKMLLETFQ